MAINSWLHPKITDHISESVPFIQKALTALLKMEPASVSDTPTGAKRMTLPNASQWKIEKYDGTNWVAAGKLMHDVDTVDGYHAAITPAKNTLAVRNADGVLQDSITGNAATATQAVALSAINPLSMGGTGSNTAAGARTNLGVPPISHASTANTYGLGSDANYGHVKLSDAVDGIESVANGTAATPKAVKIVKDAADAAQSSANNAQSSADAAMAKASTLATASAPGIVKPGKGMSVNAAGALNVSLNNTVTSTSTTDAATSNAVKTAYDKAVEANDKAVEADNKAGIIRLFNSRIVITTSNAAWTPPVTGWARVTVIGGGGAGGNGTNRSTAGRGGGQGGTSSFGTISAVGGSGGGGAGSYDEYAPGGGGGGGAGKISADYVYLNKSTPVRIIIGSGGRASQTSPTASDSGTYYGGNGQGPEGGRGGNARQGGIGAPGASSGGYTDIGTGYSSNGGSGATTGYGYGGGGGGGRGISLTATGNSNGEGFGGSASDGGAAGSMTNEIGGAGGPGAVIIEYYDPAKEAA